jgi:excisionase family DNA binding protein
LCNNKTISNKSLLEKSETIKAAPFDTQTTAIVGTSANGKPKIGTMRKTALQTNLMTIPQVGEELQLHRSTVYGWIKAGMVPAVKLGRSLRVRRTDLEAVINASRTFSRQEALA